MSGRGIVTTGTLTLLRREAERAHMHPFVDLSVDPQRDPSLEENYDGLPGEFCDCHACTVALLDEPINDHGEDYAV